MSSIGLFRHTEGALQFQAGEVVFTQGDVGSSAYVVQTGEVDIIVDGAVVDTAIEGSLIGEMALVQRSPRSATAIAKTNAALVELNERKFLHLIQQTPFFALEVIRILASRLRATNKMVSELRAKIPAPGE